MLSTTLPMSAAERRARRPVADFFAFTGAAIAFGAALGFGAALALGAAIAFLPEPAGRPRFFGAAAGAAATGAAAAATFFGRPGPRLAGAASAAAPLPAASFAPVMLMTSSTDALRSAPRMLIANCEARLSIVLFRVLISGSNKQLGIGPQKKSHLNALECA